MMKYEKNAKTGNRVHLQKQLMNFSPFDLRDTSYLDHLHTESKLRQSREAMLLLRKDMIEANKRSNYEKGRPTWKGHFPALATKG